MTLIISQSLATIGDDLASVGNSRSLAGYHAAECQDTRWSLLTVQPAALNARMDAGQHFALSL